MTQPRLALCLEQTLGHRAHGRNIEEAITAAGIEADIVRVEYPERTRVPLPWAIRGSDIARRMLRARPPADVTLFHTQTVSLFAPQAVRGGKYIVSLDATPLQVDAMGHWYQHGQHHSALERGKGAWYRAVLARAAGVVAWSEWAAASLAADYGVDRARVLVAHPGAGPSFFDLERERGPLPRILFVGGDFERKGGPDLLRAFEQLRGKAELVLVTGHPVPAAEGVRVESGVTPGSERLHRAFATADIFCLPTYGDCTSVAIGEALAAGLPVVTTTVGSNAETVREGETGFLIPPGDPAALAEVLLRLAEDAGLRERMGAAARADARARMDAAANAGRIIEFMEAAA